MRVAALCLILAVASTPVAAQESPEGRVAALARHALAVPDAPATWSALADALPELAMVEGVGLEEAFEAARIADSLALVALGPLTRAGSEAPARPLETREDLFPTGPAVLVMLGAGVAALAWLRLRARRRPAPAAPSREGLRRGRAWTARELGRDGQDLAEVARRTGMTREAVALTLRLEGAGRRRIA